MKWPLAKQQKFLNTLGKPVYGTKDTLAQRILGCISIEKAQKFVKEYRVNIALEKSRANGMELDMEDNEAVIKKAQEILREYETNSALTKSNITKMELDMEEDTEEVRRIRDKKCTADLSGPVYKEEDKMRKKEGAVHERTETPP